MNWNAIVNKLGPKLYRFFSLRSQGDLEASDYVQETLLRLYKKVKEGHYEPKSGELSSFAYGIAFNIQKEAYRQKTKWDHEELLEEEKEDKRISHEDARTLHRLALKKAILTLSSSEQNVIQLLLDRDLSMREIAEILDIPINTVKSHAARAKKKLREILEEKGGVK